MNSALKQPDTQIVAISEVVQERLDHGLQTANKFYSEASGKKWNDVRGYIDFREMLGKESLDAVIIATPDHWHSVQCLMAADKKLDIYCEKPLTLNIREGRIISDAVKKHQLVFQTGSQQRSEFGHRFKKAAELIRNGYFGEIKKVYVNVGAPPVPCDLPGEAIPDGTHWDLWIGPAPYRDYNPILCPKGIHNHFPAFRNYSEFAGGPLADIGAHHFDIVQWALNRDNSGPMAIQPPEDGGKRNLTFTYANGTQLIHGGQDSITFHGSEGTLKAGRSQLESSIPNLVDRDLPSSDISLGDATDHMRNWIDAIHSRKDPICTAEIGHRSATICHLATIGYLLNRPLNWDPESETFSHDPEANKLLLRNYRAPWNLPQLTAG